MTTDAIEHTRIYYALTGRVRWNSVVCRFGNPVPLRFTVPEALQETLGVSYTTALHLYLDAN